MLKKKACKVREASRLVAEEEALRRLSKGRNKTKLIRWFSAMLELIHEMGTMLRYR